MIVREKLETEEGSPELLTAMIKRKKGFNPAANDWEFLLISGDATKVRKREKTGACQSCHASVSEKDFVFDRYLPVSTSVSPVMSGRSGPEVLQFADRVPIKANESPCSVLIFRLKKSGSGP